jgi:hypothetical protein
MAAKRKSAPQKAEPDAPSHEMRVSPLMSEPDAARYLLVSQSFLKVSRMKKSKRRHPGPPFVRMGRSVKYRVADLDAWLEAQTEMPGR